MFNVDENGLTIVLSKVPQVVGKKGKKQIGALTAAERGRVTMYYCLLHECLGYLCATHYEKTLRIFR